MSADADVVFVNGEVHTLGERDETYEAVAVRDGRVARLDDDYETGFSIAVDTAVVDLDGRVLVPGFADWGVDLLAAADRGATARERLAAAQRAANERGVTAVRDAAGRPDAAGAYREADREGALTLRAHLDYPRERLHALEGVGARTGHGSARVRTGALRVDAEATEDVAGVIARAAAAGLGVATRVADAADVATVLDAYEATPVPSRHRVERAERATAAQLSRMADLGVAASVRPTAVDDDTHRAVDESGVRAAFAGGVGLLDPLDAVAAAVEAGVSATAAVRTATRGMAGLAVGARADFAVLDGSPWDGPRDAAVSATVVGGDVVAGAE